MKKIKQQYAQRVGGSETEKETLEVSGQRGSEIKHLGCDPTSYSPSYRAVICPVILGDMSYCNIGL